MDTIKTFWPPKGRAAIIAWSGAGAAALLGVVAAFAWPALVRPEPPSEATVGGQGMRINLVEPPKAATPQVSQLDVGLSEAALAMANGREALASAWSSEPPPRPAPPRRASVAVAPTSTTPLLVEDDRVPPVRPEEIKDRWSRDRDADDRYEAGERRRWEAERLAQEERAERRALRRAERRQERDRWDDGAAPRDGYEAPPPEDRPPPERW
jgi:hypothetical protein